MKLSISIKLKRSFAPLRMTNTQDYKADDNNNDTTLKTILTTTITNINQLSYDN
jgi:hypothetical protein